MLFITNLEVWNLDALFMVYEIKEILFYMKSTYEILFNLM